MKLLSRTEDNALEVLQILSSVICSLDGGDRVNKEWLENVSEHWCSLLFFVCMLSVVTICPEDMDYLVFLYFCNIQLFALSSEKCLEVIADFFFQCNCFSRNFWISFLLVSKDYVCLCSDIRQTHSDYD